MRGSDWLRNLTPLKIASLYSALGLLWIAVSDYFLLRLFVSERVLLALQPVIGGIFIAFSAVLIWGLMRRREQEVQSSKALLQRVSQRLHVLQRVFRHNIRNEMTVIRGNFEIAQDKITSQQALDRLEIANGCAENVMDISQKLQIVDRYDVESQIETRIDLVSTIESKVSEFSSEYSDPTIETDLPAELWIQGDDSVAEILTELLENAARHYDSTLETLEIGINAIEEGNQVRVDVIDNGPGIPQEDIQAIREGRESKLSHSSSVGLWVVYWLCERIEAEINIQSSPSDGTDVSLRFQRASPNTPR